MKLKMFLIGLFLSFFLGVTIIVLQLQHNVQLRTIIEKKIQKEIQQFCKCRYKAELGSVTFFNPSVTLENVTLYDYDNQWSITLDKMICETSWLSYLQYGTFLLTCTLDTVTIKTYFSGTQCSLVSHFTPLFQKTSQGSFSYCTPYKINLKNASVVGTNLYLKIIASLKADGTAFITNNNYVSSGTVSDSSVMIYDKPALNAISGQWAYNNTLINGERYHAALFQGEADLCVGTEREKKCTLEATVDKARTVHVYNGSTLDISYALQDAYTYAGTAKFPCKYLPEFIELTQETVHGTTSIQYSGDFSGNLQARVTLKDLGFKTINIPTVTIDTTRKNMLCSGTYTIGEDEKLAEGKWSYDFSTNYCDASITNTAPIPLISKDWVIQQNSVDCSVIRNAKEITGGYVFVLKHVPTDTPFTINAHYTYDNNILTTKGLCNSCSFDGIIDTIPVFMPRTFNCLKENKESLISYQKVADTEHDFDMNISYDLFYNALEQFADYSLPGRGDVHIAGTVDTGKIRGSIEALDALIRIPEMYNFLSEFKTNFSIQYAPFIIECQKLQATLHKGTLQAQSLNFGYDQDNFFMHLPFQFHDCLLNKKNSFFAQTSGSILFSKKRSEGPELSGTVIIEKGTMRENPFSLEGQLNVTSSILPSVIFEDKPLNLHMHILTKDPIVIKTPQISSQASCDILIGNTLQEPHLKGILSLLGGTLEFPYKPLTITTAHIYFIPNSRNDHQLEIVAQGVIKNYTVIIAVTGTARDPHIALTSSPMLPEEQIISLLYTGSTQDSLNVIIPTFLTSNLQQRILGAAQSNDPSKFSWLDKLKRIHILPSFADQSGRGGFRGTIEIDISDRLRASLQKNFSLSEDTRIEVEYDFSDEIVIKGIKDERSDIGAEIEMRFKF